jgi:multiple sugar transport system ATP-binding protein
MASPVTVEALTRRFSGSSVPAVDALSFVVEAGETLALVGPSGCGKSTTLRMIAGLDVPDSGAIHIGERSMAGVAPQDRDVAMVFQGFALYPHMKVRDILAFPLKMRRRPRQEREQHVRDVSELLGITKLLDRRPPELSGGEQQRVAMGRALVRRPEVFLFDEPLSNLDAALRAELRGELARLLRRLEATALYVTHDQAEAMTLGHRIAVLRQGRLEQLDTPRRIYEEPASTFVASFFGTPPMNLLEVTRTSEGAAAGNIGLPPPPELAPARLVVGFRPEHVRIDRSGASGNGAYVGRITAREPLGSETHLELDVRGTVVRARLPGLDAPEIGEEVSFVLNPARLRWFDAETGLAL